jgi:hypothetical protein
MQHLTSLENLAVSAFRWTSFDPDKRGRETIESYNADLIQLLSEVPEEKQDYVKEKFIKMLSAWLSAHSRCASSMITGPSNFPVERNRKANDVEHKRMGEFIQWRENIAEKLNRKPKPTPADELTETKELIEELKQAQNSFKIINKIFKNGKEDYDSIREEIECSFDYQEKTIALMIAESRKSPGVAIFPPYMFTNNLAKIKHHEAKLTKLQEREEKSAEGNKTWKIGEIEAVENYELDRFQLFFPDKPEADTRKKLKMYGFRWAPSHGCWQCFLSGYERKLQSIEL